MPEDLRVLVSQESRGPMPGLPLVPGIGFGVMCVKCLGKVGFLPPLSGGAGLGQGLGRGAGSARGAFEIGPAAR